METQGSGAYQVLPPNKSLYALTGDYLSIMQAVEDADGEINEEQLEALKITRESLQSKALAYTHVRQTLSGQLALAEAELKRIQDYMKAKKSQIEVLENNLLSAVKLFGEADKTGVIRLEIATETGVVRLSTRKSEAVNITDQDQLPGDFWRTPAVPEPQPDKTAIKAALKAGESVPGAELQINHSLVIK